MHPYEKPMEKTKSPLMESMIEVLALVRLFRNHQHENSASETLRQLLRADRELEQIQKIVKLSKEQAIVKPEGAR